MLKILCYHGFVDFYLLHVLPNVERFVGESFMFFAHCEAIVKLLHWKMMLFNYFKHVEKKITKHSIAS